MHLFVFGRGDETRRGLGLVNGAIAVDLCAARLRLRVRPQRLRTSFCVIETAASAVDASRSSLARSSGCSMP
jgi:hypothetical protein